jgi:hypothetical protein
LEERQHIDFDKLALNLPAHGIEQCQRQDLVLRLQSLDSGAELFEDLFAGTGQEQVFGCKVEPCKRSAQASEQATTAALFKERLRHQVFIHHPIHLSVRQASNECRFCGGDEECCGHDDNPPMARKHICRGHHAQP